MTHKTILKTETKYFLGVRESAEGIITKLCSAVDKI